MLGGSSERAMALLAAPVSATAEDPWLRACAASGLALHVVHGGAGGVGALERGLEDLLRVAEQRGCVWVALLAGERESVGYGLSVLGVSAAAAVLPSAGAAMAAVVDGCAGATHRVVLMQCAAGDAGAVLAALRAGDVGAAARVARVAVVRDAAEAFAVVGMRGGEGALLWRVAVPGPAPVAVGRSPVRSSLRGRVRLPSRLGGVLATVLIAAVAAGGAGWVLVHRTPAGSATLGPIEWRGSALAGDTPPPRVSAMAATWDRTAEVILYGGADAGTGHGTPLSDTWRGALQPGAAWTAVTSAEVPPARLAGAVASDPADGYVLLYGGEGPGDTGLGDTWTYGGTWSALQPQHAPPAGPGLATTEPSTGRVLLVTACCTLGAVPTGERMQTWRWTGSDWTLLGSAPGWVTSASVVADRWDGTVVMVASAGGGLGATFVWDGASWHQPGAASPPVAAGSRPRLAYDPRSHTVLDVVTRADGQHSTWAWDGHAWTLRESAGGPPVVGLVLAEPVDGHAVLYGGTAEADEFTQLWYWTGSGWAESIRPPAVAAEPSARFGAAATTDPGTGGVVLFGGDQTPGETWLWSGSDWTEAFSTSAVPPGRVGASMAYDPVSRQAWMVGGRLADGGGAGDMWVWRGSSWRRVAVGALPPASFGAPMAWDRARGEAVLVVPAGGAVGPLAVGQTWVFDGASWSARVTAVSPPLRDGSSMAFDPSTGGVLLVVPCCEGSSTAQGVETWLWDGSSWHRLQPVHSPPPPHASIALDAVHGRVVLVAACCEGSGGATVGPPQTWTWDGRDWARADGAALPALQDVGAVVTDGSGAVLLAGRLAGAGPRHPLDGLWRWTGAAWERLF
jgi:hypothetical protein